MKFVAEGALDFIANDNFLTPNILNVKFLDVISEDKVLFEAEAIKSVLPFFDELVREALNLILYPNFIDLSKAVGFPVKLFDIAFNQHNVHLQVIF